MENQQTNELESKLLNALSKETPETLNNWIESKRENKKLSAIEWLVDNIQSDMMFIDVIRLIEKAKEMDKEQKKEISDEEIYAICNRLSVYITDNNSASEVKALMVGMKLYREQIKYK